MKYVYYTNFCTGIYLKLFIVHFEARFCKSSCTWDKKNLINFTQTVEWL